MTGSILCECTQAKHLGRQCGNESTRHCEECGLALCSECNAARWDSNLKGMSICHTCYRRITNGD
jgi:hypothetical protein